MRQLARGRAPSIWRPPPPPQPSGRRSSAWMRRATCGCRGSGYPPTGNGGQVVQSVVWPAGAGPATGPPSAPTDVRATVSGNIVSLTWSAPTTGAAPTGYSLIGRTTLGGPVLATLPMGVGKSFQRSGARRFSSCSPRRPRIPSGTSPESSAVTVTVPQAATQPPGRPATWPRPSPAPRRTSRGRRPLAAARWKATCSCGGARSCLRCAIATLPLGPSASASVTGRAARHLLRASAVDERARHERAEQRGHGHRRVTVRARRAVDECRAGERPNGLAVVGPREWRRADGIHAHGEHHARWRSNRHGPCGWYERVVRGRAEWHVLRACHRVECTGHHSPSAEVTLTVGPPTAAAWSR